MKPTIPGLLFLLAACGSAEKDPHATGRTEAPPMSFVTPLGNGGGALTIPVSAPAPNPVLLPGDLLTVQVFRQPDLALEVRIPQGGKITYPLIGPVKAAGQTSAALENEIRRRLEKDYLNKPSVTVTVKEFTPRKVYIIGGVEKPDGYLVTPTTRLTLLQLVAAAGGFTDRAYKEFVQIVRRRNGKREVIKLSLVDVERAVAKGHAEADLELWPDDLVVIPSAIRVAYVLGAVNKPGFVDIPTDATMTVSMAVSQAGSYNKFASTGSIQVLRHTPGGETRKMVVDLDAVLNGEFEKDIVLQPGDVIWVPERGIF